jgi:Exonuclease
MKLQLSRAVLLCLLDAPPNPASLTTEGRIAVDNDSENVDMQINLKTWLSNCSKRITGLFSEISCHGRFNVILNHEVLSLELMECMGFPLYIKEDGLPVFKNVATKDSSSYRATHEAPWACSLQQQTVSIEVEEGECSDEDDEEVLIYLNLTIIGAVFTFHLLLQKIGISQSTCQRLVSREILSALGEGKLRMCAIDCEMCTTDIGLELTRISILSPELSALVVLDTLVVPSSKIIDYHTEFSGITEELMRGVSTTFDEVLNELKQLIGPHTILVGHSLDSDLKALRIAHHRVLDTTALFPSIRGMPFKTSLKTLAATVLGLEVQVGGNLCNHPSFQTC